MKGPIRVGCGRELAWKWRGDLFMARREDVRRATSYLEGERFTVKDKETGDARIVPWKELEEDKQKEELLKQVRKISQVVYKRMKDSTYREVKDTVRYKLFFRLLGDSVMLRCSLFWRFVWELFSS